MILPLAAFALPALTARSVVKASSGLSLFLTRSNWLLLLGFCTPCLAILMAVVSAVLMRGLAANFGGNECRQVGQVFLPWATHFFKHARQKLCWHGACKQQKHNVGPTIQSCGAADTTNRFTYCDRSRAEIHAHGALQAVIKHSRLCLRGSRCLAVL